MSVVQRVIILNKPFKIRGYTILQWIVLTAAVAIAFVVGSKVPHEWKVANLPVGFLLGLLIFCGAIVFVSATQMRPMVWWRNVIFYRLNLIPKIFLPHREDGPLYPDPSIIDPGKREDQPYVTFED